MIFVFHVIVSVVNRFSPRDAHAVRTVVKVLWDTKERHFCTSDYWQIAILHLQVRTGTVGGTLQELLCTTKCQHLCKMIDDSCLLQAHGVTTSASHGWGFTLNFRGPRRKVPHLRFSTLTHRVSVHSVVYVTAVCCV